MMHTTTAASLAPDSSWTSAAAHDIHHTWAVRLAALLGSGVSVAASLIAFYWFCRMDKLFRHRLVMLLVYGDLMRSTWYFAFAVYSTARGTVKTQTKLCQSSGWFIQYGAETSDYAVLVIAVHSALQVFHPKTRGTSDGLYNVRYYVYFGAFILPVLMASLAFINPGHAYESLGAFCTLPVRPFWYRLALAWIPRYLIAATILCLAVAIYAYVGFEFRSYAGLSQSLNTPTTPTGISRTDRDTEAAVERAPRTAEPTENVQDDNRRASSIAHDVVASHRRGSAVVFADERQAMARTSTVAESHTQSLPGSSTHLSGKRAANMRPPLINIPSGQSIKAMTEPSTTDCNLPLSPMTQSFNNPLERITSPSGPASNPVTAETSPTTTTTFRPDLSPNSASARHLQRQRMRIHRQLRLMFIYPLVYTLMWLIPFVQHCMNYSYYYANHPIYWMRLAAAICITSMGFIDCLIFSIREKPWRSIQTSDGTLWGSFAVWRSPGLSNAGNLIRRATGGSVGTQADAGVDTNVTRVRTSVRTSASDDYARIAAEQARVRLDMERDERIAMMKERVVTRMKDQRVSDETESEESKYSEKEEEVGSEGEGKGKEREREKDGDEIGRVDWKRER